MTVDNGGQAGRYSRNKSGECLPQHDLLVARLGLDASSHAEYRHPEATVAHKGGNQEGRTGRGRKGSAILEDRVLPNARQCPRHAKIVTTEQSSKVRLLEFINVGYRAHRFVTVARMKANSSEQTKILELFRRATAGGMFPITENFFDPTGRREWSIGFAQFSTFK